jgi:hypothetical protein
MAKKQMAKRLKLPAIVALSVGFQALAVTHDTRILLILRCARDDSNVRPTA